MANEDLLKSDKDLENGAMPKAQRLNKLPVLLIGGFVLLVVLISCYGIMSSANHANRKVSPIDDEKDAELVRDRSAMGDLNGRFSGNIDMEELTKDNPQVINNQSEGTIVSAEGNDPSYKELQQKYNDLESRFNELALKNSAHGMQAPQEVDADQQALKQLRSEVASFKKNQFMHTLQSPTKVNFSLDPTAVNASGGGASMGASASRIDPNLPTEQKLRIIRERREEAARLAAGNTSNTGTAVNMGGGSGGATSLSSSNSHYGTGTGTSAYTSSSPYSIQNSGNHGGYSGTTMASYSQFSNNNNWTLNQQMETPTNDFVVRAGTVIPATLITGVNSDTPGQIMGQVSQNVYDTATGFHMLIPQGTRIIGSYGAGTIFGQERVLVAWQRLVFPDGKVLDLGSMPGADMSGNSGFHDQVDNHWWKLISSAFLMSGITASVIVAADRGTNSSNSSSNSSSATLRSALASQFGSVVARVIERNLAVNPTLTIRPGYNFNVTVTKDITFNKAFQSFDYK